MGEAPKRIQRRRVKGWRMPEGAVAVDRSTRWGNPFRATGHTPEQVVEAYRGWMEHSSEGRWLGVLAIQNLRGRDLACWCRPGAACHADVLLEIANAPLRCEAASGGGADGPAAATVAPGAPL